MLAILICLWLLAFLLYHIVKDVQRKRKQNLIDEILTMDYYEINDVWLTEDEVRCQFVWVPYAILKKYSRGEIQPQELVKYL